MNTLRPMPLFDCYIMVDWSGGNSRRSNRKDCIWIAHGSSDQPVPACGSPSSRTEATRQVGELLTGIVRSGKKALAGFDFAFGYPRGFAEHLPADVSEAPRWRTVWAYLANRVSDDVGTQPGCAPTNRSNRFEVANELNCMMAGQESLGPFWCAEPNWRRQRTNAGQPVFIPQNMPFQPFVSNKCVGIPARRLTDQAVESDHVFRLFGNGSVGSQAITGIPRLNQLRAHPDLRLTARVWPFETGWAPADGSDGWLAGLQVVLAEIYPSVREPFDDTVRDRGQVRAMWHWVRDLDQGNTLLARFAGPVALAPAAEQAVLNEEGWVLH